MRTIVTLGHVQPADVDAVFALLADNELPTAGLRDHLSTTFVARTNGHVVGSAALEMYPDGALLRSVAVAEAARGQGVARQLVDATVQYAEQQGVPALYLLTTTAEHYFPRFGFERVSRDDVPPGVRTSIEFTSACPASAVVMRRTLGGTRS